MTTQNVKENLISNEFIKFSFRDFKTKMVNGEEKKDFTPPQGWSNLTKSSLNQEHVNIGILTGEINNLTVLDYDDKNVFNEDNIKFKFFQNNYYIVETKNGYHIYFNYVNIDSALKIGESKKIDFLNNGRFVIAPPTRYNLLDGTLITYKLKKGSVKKDMPEDLINYIQGLIDIKNGINKPIEEPKQENADFGIIPVENKPLKYNMNTNDYIPYMYELLDCLSVSRADDREDWLKVGMILKKLGCDSALYHNFSSKSSKYEQKNCDDTWNSLKADNSLNIGTLILYAKTDDPSKLDDIKKMMYEKKNIKKVEKTEIKKSEVKDEVKADEKIEDEIVFCDNDNDASKYLFNKLKDKFKSYRGRLFYLNKNIWICDDELINNVVLQYVMNSKIYLSNDKNKLIPYAQNVSRAKKIMEALYSKIIVDNNDEDLYIKFHTTTKGKICFNDGVLDFKNKKFIKWTSDDLKKNPIYSTIKIDRDYEEYFNNPIESDISDITTKIFENLYGDKKDLALHFLSRALAGHHEDKRWATYLGSRNCGKGVEYDLLEAFQKYVNTFELGNMLYCRKTAGMENVDCSKKLYWLIDLEFTRLAVSQEIPENKSGMIINGKMLKKITGGGDTIVARRNYDRKDTHFKIDTTFYIKGNYSLECDSKDCNETKIEFSSVIQFKTDAEIKALELERTEQEMKRYKPADFEIKNKCKTLEWQNAIIYLIYRSYKNSCIESKKEIELEDNDILKGIEDNFTITNNDSDIIKIKDVYNILDGLDKGKISDELASMNVFKKKDRVKERPEFLNQYCFYGLIKKEILKVENKNGVAEYKN